MRKKIILVLAFLLAGIPVGVSAAPKLLPFQAHLTDSSGAAVPDGAKVVQFKIYDAPVSGTAVWAGEVHKLSVNKGLVNTILGTKTSMAGVDFSGTLYLEITVDAQNEGQTGYGQITAADPPLLPRQIILPAVFAFGAEVAGKLKDSDGNAHNWSAVFEGGVPGNGKIHGDNLKANTISADRLSGNISGGQLTEGTITSREIGAGAVGDEELAAGIVGEEHLQAGLSSSLQSISELIAKVRIPIRQQIDSFGNGGQRHIIDHNDELLFELSLLTNYTGTDGVEIIRMENDSATTRTKFIANMECVVTVSIGATMGPNTQPYIKVNANQLAPATVAPAVDSAARGGGGSGTVLMKKDDVLTIGTDYPSLSVMNFILVAEADVPLVPVE